MDDQSPDPAAPAAPPTGPGRFPRLQQRHAFIVAAVALLVLAGVLVWLATTATSRRDAAIRSTAAHYLQAIADADADGALARLATKPDNRTLLTDDVLAASREAAPLTDVQVRSTTVDDREATATVSYRLGDREVVTRLDLTGNGGSRWGIQNGLSELVVTQTQALRVNGATLTESSNPVLPGTYTAVSALDRVTVVGTPTAVIESPTISLATLVIDYQLTEQGTAEVLETVRSAFDTCLASTQSRPVGCPFGVETEHVEIGADGVHYALVNDPWEGFAPSFDPQTQSATGSFTFEVTATATVTFEGRSGLMTAPLQATRSYAVDLAAEPLAVVWS